MHFTSQSKCIGFHEMRNFLNEKCESSGKMINCQHHYLKIIKIKNLIKVFCLATFVLVSCETEKEIELNQEVITLDEELQKEHKGILEINSKTYVFKKNGVNSKFKNDMKEYNFSFLNDVTFKSESSKSDRHELLIKNPVTDEFILLYNKKVKDNTIEFDVKLSNGKILESVKYYSSEKLNQAKCPYCWPIAYVVKEVVEAIIEAESEDYDSNCSKAIDACGDAGVEKIVITEGGWFEESSCTVTCK